jgi:hypothetical protein
LQDLLQASDAISSLMVATSVDRAAPVWRPWAIAKLSRCVMASRKPCSVAAHSNAGDYTPVQFRSLPRHAEL